MTMIRPRHQILAALAVCLLAVGVCQIGSGLWIYAKARLAQPLLQRAWTRTLAGDTHATPWPWADTWPVARLIAPAHGVDQIVLEGAYGRTLAFGPGHVETSEPLEASQTILLTGHRDTHFAFLERLRLGDELRLETSAPRQHRYRVTALDVVDTHTTDRRLATGGNALILVTCYPFHAMRPGSPLRYVVTAEPIMPEADESGGV